MLSQTLLLALFVAINCVIDYLVFRQVSKMAVAYGDLRSRVDRIEAVLNRLLEVLGTELEKHGQYIVSGVAGALSIISKETVEQQTGGLKEVSDSLGWLGPVVQGMQNIEAGGNSKGFLGK